MSTTDALNNVLTYTYHSNGNLKSVNNGGTTLQTYTYDAFNNLTERWDPNYGTYKYTYDAYGEQLSVVNPKNQKYTYEYDLLGRMNKKTGPEGDYIYQYEGATGTNCGKMTSLTGPEGTITYSYGMGDKIYNVHYNGLAAGLTGISSYGNYNYDYAYNNFGLLNSKYYSSGTSLQYTYGLNGEQRMVEDITNGTVFYEKQNENAAGQSTRYAQKGGFNNVALVTEISYDSYNLMTGQETTYADAGLVRLMSYAFDPATGNLTSRKDNKYGLQESFFYDNQNRLTGVINTNNSLLSTAMQYSSNGNITKKGDAGDFEYDPNNKLVEITNFKNIPHATQQLDYTPFDKVKTIDEGKYHTEFHYWPDGSRSMMITTNMITGVREYKMYAPDMEFKYNTGTGKKECYTYIGAPDGTAVGWQAVDQTGKTDHFLLSDYLGSFTQVVDASGNIEEEKSYDAWGRLRTPQTWEPYASNIDAGQPQQKFDRGYTGHEYLPYYGIINMNGRLYDPVMGRMFSAGPVMGSGGSLQGYNRYTYALNNPLKYTDPSGDVIVLAPILVAVAYGSLVGAASSAAMYSVMAGNNWTWSGFGKSALFGGIAGGLSAGVGSFAAGASSSAFFQSVGFNILKNSAVQIGTNAAFGNNVNFGSVLGSVAGSFVMSSMPAFTGVKGGAFANIVGELAQSGASYGAGGFVSGGVSAGLNGDNILGGAFRGLDNGIKGGLVQSGLMIGTFGAGYLPSEILRNKLSKIESLAGANSGRFSPLYRRGGVYELITKRGVTWGRNLVVPGENTDGYTTLHEYGHYMQSILHGFGNMQMKGIFEQLMYGNNAYEPTLHPFSNEVQADNWYLQSR